jgi:hypothetical protein
VRLEAKLKEAELLQAAGRVEEALAATREVDRLYREGMAEVTRLLGDAPGPAPAEPPVVDEGSGAEVNEDASPGAGQAGALADTVLHALQWLAAHQSPDGGWQAEGFGPWCKGQLGSGPRADGAGKAVYDVGVTGLALCAFLGGGYSNRGAHEFAQVVRTGLAYLKNVQDPEGCFGPRATQHYFYNHAIATLAMVEAYGMTESPILKAPAQKALDFIAVSRNPYFGWRYGVKPGDNDTSTTAWATMALRSARQANASAVARGQPAPFTIDEEAFAGVKSWLDKMTDPDTGRVGYVTRGSGPARSMEVVDRFPASKSESLTAAGMLLRILMGEDPAKSDAVRKGAELVRRLPPVWNPTDGSIDMYYWYYGTLAMFQVGGEAWRGWSSALTSQVARGQRLDGDACSFKGSWDPVDPWGREGGRVYSTALLAMCAEVALRYERVGALR